MKRALSSVAAIIATSALALAGCASGTTDTTSSAGSAAAGDSSYSIGIAEYVSHPSLDSSVEGFKEAIEAAGLDVTYDEQNSQGDQATGTAIASKFAGQDLDLVLAVATPIAQAMAQSVTSIPVLFTAVTDPVAAELVDSNEAPGANLTGTTDMNPVADQIDLIKKLNPEAKTFGIIYSSGEVNSEVQVKLAREEAAAQGLEVVEKTITNSSEVLQAAQALGDVDAIYVPTDNMVVSALDSVLQAAEAAQIPVVVGESDSVAKGGVITYGLNYKELGKQTGEMAVKILTEGADPATMAVESQKNPQLVINTAAAARMGVTVPQELLDQADQVIKQ
ncbi:MAG: ABC transporter substrate-binding protein [Corynebacterium sp.]|nr:ABC transporter substrate-binding protein [Corynebacterium sp.]